MKSKNITELAREIVDSYIFNHTRPESQFYLIVLRENLSLSESLELFNAYRSLL